MSAQGRTRLSVVVPVHNEAGFLPVGLPVLVTAVDAFDPGAEILVVENGSTDATADLARRIGGDRVRVVSLPQPDYGGAMRHGFQEAEGAWVVNFDIDYFSERFLRRIDELGDRADIIISSKRDPGSVDRRSLLRRLATLGFNLLLRTLFGSRVSDTHGMKAFRREVIAAHLPAVASRQDLFDTELVLRAERAGCRIVEVPVVVSELRPARSALLRRVPRTLRGLWRIRRSLRTTPAG